MRHDIISNSCRNQNRVMITPVGENHHQSLDSVPNIVLTSRFVHRVTAAISVEVFIVFICTCILYFIILLICSLTSNVYFSHIHIVHCRRCRGHHSSESFPFGVRVLVLNEFIITIYTRVRLISEIIFELSLSSSISLRFFFLYLHKTSIDKCSKSLSVRRVV